MSPGVRLCKDCLCWVDGQCRLRAPVIGLGGRGVWPITDADDGCHEQVSRPRASGGERLAPDQLEWRVLDVWDTHLRARRKHFQNLGLRPKDPTFTREIRKAIVEAIREHDRGLLHLTRDQYAEWKEHSMARAAGVGIFLSDFHTGKNQEQRNYLEAWRPWRRRRGEPDPVTGFAERYFQAKAKAGEASAGGEKG